MLECDKIKINKMCNSLKLPVEVASEALGYCQKVLQSKKLEKRRINSKSLHVACIYIATRIIQPDRNITQYDLSYNFKISPMTIRKVYRQVCEILGIDRTKIVGANKPFK